MMQATMKARVAGIEKLDFDLEWTRLIMQLSMT
jgi:hypothetical protein